MRRQSEMIRGVFDLPDREGVCAVEPGTLLTEAAEAAGVVLDVSCGGAGVCGGCALQLVEGRFEDAAGAVVESDGGTKHVLGCQVRALGDFRVRVPSHSLVTADEKALVDFDHLPRWALSPSASKRRLQMTGPTLTDQDGDIERIRGALGDPGRPDRLACSLAALRDAPSACRDGHYDVTVTLDAADGTGRLVRVEPGDTTACLYGVAVDIGTTTVVCSLVDLRTGRITETASSYNQQVRRCNDVASRITCASTPDGLAELNRLIVDATINRLVGLLVRREGISRLDVARMSIAANSVMTHLLLRVDPTHLGAVPFQPASNAATAFAAAELGIDIHPAASVDIAPARAAYIGGDITADLVVCGLCEADEPTLLVDIGTNAEIVAGSRDRVIACAAPAGPAFEGQGTTCGMRAGDGAIDTLRIDPVDLSCRYSVIGGGAPVGLCGSALISFMGQAYKAGLISRAGRLDLDVIARTNPDCLATIRRPDGSESRAYVIAAAEQTDDKLRPIVITEADIAVLMQAKGVIYAGIEIALKHAGKRLEDLHRIYLAGGFARRLDLADAVTMGLLPDVPLDRYVFIGNGSLAGAYLRLIDRSFADAMTHAASRPEVIELNLDEDFQDAYTMAMLLP